MGLEQARLLELPRVTDPGASLTFIEAARHIPFDIQRVYYLYGIAPGQQRGGHAHKLHQELIIAIAGSFEIVLDDSRKQRRYTLDRPDRGVLFPTMVWHELENFSPNAICLVLASLRYDDEDYFRDYAEFCRATAGVSSAP